MSEDKKIFLLIDGSAIIHRAYHAMPSFTSADGKPTGAVHGFMAMLLKLISEFKPTYLAIAFDRAAPTFRQEMFVGYHANRPKIASDLGEQFDYVREILNSGKIPVYEVDGFEADDVIGTINAEVNKYHKETIVYIVTGDRDLLQLLDQDTKIVMPVKGISEVMVFDRVRVKEKYGVEPEQIIDYKALIGDPSDNYPGVAGVGPKTASGLLAKYNTFESIYHHISEIEKENPKLALKLANGAEQAAMAKKLATIECNTPFVFEYNDCKFSNVSEQGMLGGFAKYELKTLSKRLVDVFKNLDSDNKSQMKLL